MEGRPAWKRSKQLQGGAPAIRSGPRRRTLSDDNELRLCSSSISFRCICCSVGRAEWTGGDLETCAGSSGCPRRLQAARPRPPPPSISGAPEAIILPTEVVGGVLLTSASLLQPGPRPVSRYWLAAVARPDKLALPQRRQPRRARQAFLVPSCPPLLLPPVRSADLGTQLHTAHAARVLDRSLQAARKRVVAV